MDPSIALGVTSAYIIIASSKRRRRWWRKEFLRNGDRYGNTLMAELLLNDGSEFKNFLRLTKSDFEELLQLVAPKICKRDTNFRKAIPPAIRLAVTLRYLATGDSYNSLMYLFKISKQCIGRIVSEVCEAITDSLKQYCRAPRSEQEWCQIADGFNKKWNFPHCIGALDGKHVQIEAPKNSGSVYFNYKGTFSIVLMVIADADYRILYADVGSQGRISDGGVFSNTAFYERMSRNELQIPKPQLILGGTIPLPYVLVGDDAFALSTNLMKPFPGTHIRGSLERQFNYRLSRARRIVENVFGQLATVFRIFRRPIPLEPRKVESLVLACVHLHNFLRRNEHSIQTYSPPGTFDTEDCSTGEIIPGTWRQDFQGGNLINLQSIPRRAPQTCKEIRHEFAKYFISEHGKLSWQDEVS